MINIICGIILTLLAIALIETIIWINLTIAYEIKDNIKKKKEVKKIYKCKIN
jgi:hypothetical protein